MSADSPTSRISGGTHRSSSGHKQARGHTKQLNVTVQPPVNVQVVGQQQGMQQHFMDPAQFVPIQPMMTGLPSAILSPLPVGVLQFELVGILSVGWSGNT